MSRGGLVLLILAFAVGGVMGYAVPGAGPAELPDAPPSAEPPADRPGAALPAIPPGPEDPPSAVVPAEIASGNGRITGFVRTGAGAPLAGALVRAELVKPPFLEKRHTTGVPPDADLTREVQRLVDLHRYDLATRREATSGPDGSYALEGLADGRDYALYAYRKFFMIDRSRIGANRFRAGDSLDFKASAKVEVRLAVRLPDGRIPDRAEILCEGDGRKYSVQWRPRDPLLSLDPGDWRLTAIGGPLSAYEAAPVNVALTEGEPERAVTLELAPRRGISGRILGMDGGHVGIRWLRIPGNGTVTDEELLRQGGRGDHTGAPEYRYGLFEVPDGSYRVGVVREGRVVASAAIELAGEPVIRDLTVPEEDDSYFLTVTVEGPDGGPVEDASIQTMFRPAGPGGSAWGNGRHVRGGSYRVRHPRMNAAIEGAAGIFTLHVRSDVHGSLIVPYPGPSAASQSVRFAAPGRIDVVLSGYERSAYLNRTRVRISRDAGGYFEYPYFPDLSGPTSTGRQSLGPVAPGAWEIAVQTDLEGARRLLVAKTRLQVVSGPQTVTIDLPRLCFFTLAATPEARYELRSQAGSLWSYRLSRATGRDGRATFGPLPAGVYIVRERGAGDRPPTMTVRIDEDTEAAFEPD